MTSSKVELADIKYMVDEMHEHLTAAAEILKKFNTFMGGDFEIVANVSFEKVLKVPEKKSNVVADDMVDVWERKDAEETPKDELPDCPECDGTGFDPEIERLGQACLNCNGKGFVEE